MKKRLLILAIAGACFAQVVIKGPYAAKGPMATASPAPNSNWATNWTLITEPTGVPAATGKMQSVFAGVGDGNLYVSSRLGIHRAAKSDIIANPTGPTWTTVNTGMANTGGVYESCQGWGLNAAGNPVCGAGKVNGLYICVLNLSNDTWTCTQTNIAQGDTSIKAIAMASNNDLYAISYFGAELYKSTDSGATWTVVFSSFFTDNGQAAGGPYSLAIYGNVLYMGGESAGGLGQYNLGTLGVTFDLTVAQDPAYGGNLYGIAGDGNATTGPNTEMVVQRTNSAIYRKNVGSGVWTKVAPILIPGGGGLDNEFFAYQGVSAGTATHEYYLAGGRPGFNLGGVIGTIDGGVTWAFVGDTRTCASSNCPSRVSIGPADDKWMVMNTQSLWYHP